MDKFEYIIIGAGSAGCVLAIRLSANPDNIIWLLEAGGKDSNPWIHIPGGYFKTIHNPYKIQIGVSILKKNQIAIIDKWFIQEEKL